MLLNLSRPQPSVLLASSPGPALVPHDTDNALTDFDICLALTQQAINSQMNSAWKAWKFRKQLTETIHLFNTTKNAVVVPSKTGLDAKLGPLDVSLNVPDAKIAQVQVTLHLTSGSVTYFDEDSEGLTTYNFNDWSVSFLVNLDKKPVDLNVLQTIDPDAAHTAQNVIKASGLPESVFSIEYLFMKFSEVDLMLADNKNVHIPADVPQPARDKALSNLNYLLQGQLGNFMFGAVVRRNTAQAVPTFAMTDFVFDTHPNTAAPQASTLSYEGVLGNGRKLPSDINAARTKFTDAWIRPSAIDGTQGTISGVMAISKSVFMDKYLIPEFSKNLGKSPVADHLKYTFSDSSQKNSTSSDIIDREWEAGRSWRLDIAIVPGTNRLTISGQITSRAKMDGYTKRVNFGKLGTAGHDHTEWIHIAGHQDLTGSVTLTGGGISTDFKLTPAVQHQFNGIVVDSNEVGGGAKVLSAFQGVFKDLHFIGSTTQEQLANSQQNDVNTLNSTLDQALNKININLSQHAFIPPGGGVFTFQNPRFTGAGDLIFDVIYLAP